MDRATANTLSELTSNFYRQVAPSFSSTRQAPWSGWEEVVRICQNILSERVRLLDIACGNLRFERYLAPLTHELSVVGVDNCAELVDTSNLDCALEFVSCDLAHELQENKNPFSEFGASSFDLAVSFGFLHHLPLVEQRQELLRHALACVRPGGYLVASFWQFATDPDMLSKARATTEIACKKFSLGSLEEGDYILGWQGRDDVFRYCHSFVDDEIDALVAGVSNSACEVARFSADGRGGHLNRYLVLKCS